MFGRSDSIKSTLLKSAKKQFIYFHSLTLSLSLSLSLSLLLKVAHLTNFRPTASGAFRSKVSMFTFHWKVSRLKLLQYTFALNFTYQWSLRTSSNEEPSSIQTHNSDEVAALLLFAEALDPIGTIKTFHRTSGSSSAYSDTNRRSIELLPNRRSAVRVR